MPALADVRALLAAERRELRIYFANAQFLLAENGTDMGFEGAVYPSNDPRAERAITAKLGNFAPRMRCCILSWEIGLQPCALKSWLSISSPRKGVRCGFSRVSRKESKLCVKRKQVWARMVAKALDAVVRPGDAASACCEGRVTMLDTEVCSARFLLAEACRVLPTIGSDACGVGVAFSLVSASSLKRGRSSLCGIESGPKRVAAVALRQGSRDDMVVGALFDIPESELPAYRAREHRYELKTIAVTEVDGREVAAMVCVESTDEAYGRKCRAEALIAGNADDASCWAKTLRRCGGVIWGRRDVVPMPNYLQLCLHSATVR